MSKDNVRVIKNSIVLDSLSYLRDKNTSTEDFRIYSDKICASLFYEALSDLSLSNESIETPLDSFVTQKIKEDVVIIPILRAGLSMLFGALNLLPKAKVGFAGMQRDEETALPKEYYWKIPEINSKTTVFIADPMLATGGTINYCLEKLKSFNPKNIIIVSVISAPEGISEVTSKFPDVKIITSAIDKELNSKKFIVPGLGDYGDRYFGT